MSRGAKKRAEKRAKKIERCPHARWTVTSKYVEGTALVTNEKCMTCPLERTTRMEFHR